MAAYSKTTWTNSSAPAINADNLNKIENGIEACSKATVYSTTEQVVGTWIDGKPIYRKALAFSKGSGVATLEILYNVNNVDNIWINNNASYVLNDYGGGSKYYLPINQYAGTNDYIRTAIVYHGNNVIMNFGSVYQGLSLTGYVTIEYTKTTD